ncbi:LuxR C-terminal-related transcriptional regulator [Thalassobellus citreus]|uniref:LuxR C-terminal-related transcriptional regulator n=1 Tax=Thalassobellus citreus TaxID=3367752 RepID=UPI003789C08E
MRTLDKKTLLVKHVGKRVKLTDRELYFLRLIAHNCSILEISDFLNVKEQTTYKYDLRLQRKLKCKTLTSTIVKCFKLNILNRYDFVNDKVKNIAINYTELIFNRMDELMYNNDINTLGDFIFEFYNKSEMFLQLNNNVTFNLLEKKHLELKFKGISFDDTLKEDLFKKLESNDWFNCIRKTFEYGILDRNNYLSINIKNEALSCALEMIKYQYLDNFTKKEKKLAVYNEIIKFYNTIEYDCLLKIA